MDTTIKVDEKIIEHKPNGIALSSESLSNGYLNGYHTTRVKAANGTHVDKVESNGTEPRGYVYLWGMDPIPLHELSLYPELLEKLPDHTQLPETDGEFVKNFQEHPQGILLTTSLRPRLDELHPDGQYIIGQDSGIYWRLVNPPAPPYRGAEASDWCYIPHVPPNLGDGIRRSYALWKELVPPTLVIEFVSGDGSEERDRTSYTGKFWVYENAIQPTYYAIYEVGLAKVELFHLVNGQYQQVSANSRGHYPISSMGIELGIWHGQYGTEVLPWLRAWDLDGDLLLHSDERAEQAEARARQAEEEVKDERQRADEAAAEIIRLRALLAGAGVDG